MRRARIGMVVVAALVAAVAIAMLSRRSPPVLAPTSTASPDDPPLEVAWAAVHATPRDPAAWVLLGDAQAADDQLVGAEHSYRTAIRLGGGDGLAYARLGFALYARGEDEEARVMLLEARRRGAEVAMLDATIEALTRVEAPSSPPPPPPTAPAWPPEALPQSRDASVPVDGSLPVPIPEVAPDGDREPDPEPHEERTGPADCVLPISRRANGRTFVVPVSIDGYAGELILDTGASITALTAAYARRIGVSPDYGRSLTMITANGRVQAPTAVVSELAVHGRFVEQLRVSICERCVEDIADGLLGIDVVAALQMELDVTRGVIRFGDCR